jgi:hypothetical protein
MKYFLFALLPLASVFAQEPVMKDQPLTAIKGACALPEGWHFSESTEDGVTVYQISKEKPAENGDAPAEGLILSATPKVDERASMKPSEYATELVSAAAEETGSKEVVKTEEGPLKCFRSEYAIDGDGDKILVITIAKANDQTGTLYFFTWQNPESDEAAIAPIREKFLASFKLDPAF